MAVAITESAAPQPMESLTYDSTPTTTFALQGYSWRYFTLEVPEDSVLSVVVGIDHTHRKDQDACGGRHIYTELKKTIPTVAPQAIPEGSGGGSGGGQSLLAGLLEMMRTSYFCVRKPQLEYNIKDTKNTTKWYLLVQTRGGDATTDGNRCWVTVYHHVQDTTRLDIQLVVIWFAALAFVVVSLRQNRTSRYEFRPPFRLTWLGVVSVLPLVFRHMVVKAATSFYTLACKPKESEEHGTELMAAERRGGDEEMTAVNGANSNGGSSPGEGGENDKQDEEDDDTPKCRICHEDGAREALITPCACEGSLQFIHRTCLDKWRIIAAGQNPRFTARCELCQQPFTVRLGSSAVSKAVMLRLLDVALVMLGCYVVCLIAGVVSKLTIGELECMAQYNNVEYGNPSSWSSLWLGMICYCVGGFLFLNALYLVFLEFNNDPRILITANRTGHVPPLWTSRRQIKAVIYTAWAVGFLAALGYMAKVLEYYLSDSAVWNFEFALMSGLIVLLMMGIVAAVFVLVLQLFTSKPPESNEDDDNGGDPNSPYRRDVENPDAVNESSGAAAVDISSSALAPDTGSDPPA